MNSFSYRAAFLPLSALTLLSFAACSDGQDGDGTLIGSGGAEVGASGGSTLTGAGGSTSAVGGSTDASGGQGPISGGAPGVGGGPTDSGGAPSEGGGGVQNSGGSENGSGGGEDGSGGGEDGSGGETSVGTNCEDGAASGFYVEGSKLYDVNCNEFIMRGANISHTWFTSDTQQSLIDLASVGGNAARIVLSTGGRWNRTSGSELSNIISWAKENKLVAMLEVHDSTGYPEQADSVGPDDALAYWKSDDIRAAIDGQEAYVLINIANESFGNDESDQWQGFYVGAVPELREAGLKHTFVVDAPNWGQDWANIMRDGGATPIFNADPDKNVIFAVHMYDVYSDASTVTQYFDTFAQSGLPLVVGEFAADHGPSLDVDEGTIMDQADQKGIGYLGWSWSGNGDDLGSLDITQNFNLSNLTAWGDTLINGANGIRETSIVCSCFE